MRYVVTQELRTESKLYKGLTMFDLGFIFSAFLVIKMFSKGVYTGIQPLYYVFNGIMALIFLARSPFNRGKRMFFTLYAFLIKDRFLYQTNRVADPEMPAIQERGQR